MYWKKPLLSKQKKKKDRSQKKKSKITYVLYPPQEKTIALSSY